MGYLKEIFSGSIIQFSAINSSKNWVLVLLLVIGMTIIEWMGRENQHALEFVRTGKSWVTRWLVYVVVLFAILSLGGSQQEFIYFQF